MNWSTHVAFNCSCARIAKGKTESLVEFVDIYPTLCQLCNLPFPKQLDRISFVPILKNLEKKTKDKSVYSVGRRR